jgi:hypothetical protein
LVFFQDLIYFFPSLFYLILNFVFLFPNVLFLFFLFHELMTELKKLKTIM